MRKQYGLILAAALAAGGFGFDNVSHAADDDAEVKVKVDADSDVDVKARADVKTDGGEKLSKDEAKFVFPAGIEAKGAMAKNDDIHSTFQEITGAALTKGGFDDVVERLVDQDRNRIGDLDRDRLATLDGRIDQIRTAWKMKYGNTPDVKENSFHGLTIARGVIDDPKTVASNWPIAAVARDAATAAGTADEGDRAVTAAAAAAETAASEAKTSNDDADLDSNIEKGNEVAVAMIAGSHGLPPVNVSMIREANGYRVDAPNTIGAQQLHDNLLKHLTHVGESVEQWPADEKDAAAYVAHHVMMAVTGVDAAPHAAHDHDADRARPADAADRDADVKIKVDN